LSIDVLKLVQSNFKVLFEENTIDDVLHVFTSTNQKIIPILNQKTNC